MSESRNIKALIFDMDGLMIDSERLYLDVEKEMARSFGKEFKLDTWGKLMGRKPIEGMRVFVEDLGLPISAEEALAMRNVEMRKKYRDEAEAMPGLFQIVNAFNGILKLAVCTGAQKEFLEIVVYRLGIRDKFAVLQASDEIRNGKPDPEIYLACSLKLGAKPGECVVLEDSSNGVLAANRAGCYTIAVPSEHSKNQDFRCADYVAADLFDAEMHISSLLKGTR
jgi:HAD superfamily hydrolase (TIGR01509 family)